MRPPPGTSKKMRGESAMNEKSSNYIELTADIVSAYVSNNAVAAGDISALISQVHSALLRVSNGQAEITSEALKPHLRTQYNMTPEHYREKWGLPADYPMVAPKYAEARSQLAKQMGLGQQ